VHDGESVRVDLAFTRLGGQVSGTLRTAKGQPATGYSIVVFPEETSRHRYTVATRPATNGEFIVDGLLPGRHRIAVVEVLRRNEWLVPSFIDTVVDRSVPVIVDGVRPTEISLIAQR
jgi:hypothetical protein